MTRELSEGGFSVATACRACGSKDLHVVLPLRPMPAGDKYQSTSDMVARKLYPSSIQKCGYCGHLQMECSIDPSFIYDEYLSRPATTNSGLSDIYREYAEHIAQLSLGGKVLEIGSNDGLFLQYLSRLGVDACGVEPARNLHHTATELRGVKSINAFFSPELVESLGPSTFSLVFANHALSNIENIRGFARAAQDLLSVGGTLIVQTFYQKSVLERRLIENYNHEHLSYFTVTTLNELFSRFGFELFDAMFIDAKGGSIRCFFKKRSGGAVTGDSRTERLNSLLSSEKAFDFSEAFQLTGSYIEERARLLRELIVKHAGIGHHVAAYGTSIGATVFLYQFELQDIVTAFFDDDALRQGRFSPGVGLPVYDGKSLSADAYPVCLITAPLYAKAIIEKNRRYLDEGGVFVLFWPDIVVVKRDTDLSVVL